ncbi:hypothetical protein G6F24_016232 [Rhizopus arrhizus]|nr:hypothetical protein G6F24_016232 [Rhizopus arrhizus]
MLEKLKVRTGMLLVLACFVIALALACGLSWMNADNSVREIEDLNTVAVHQVDPLYEANGALLRTRLALDDALAGIQAVNAERPQLRIAIAAGCRQAGLQPLLRLQPRFGDGPHARGTPHDDGQHQQAQQGPTQPTQYLQHSVPSMCRCRS